MKHLLFLLVGLGAIGSMTGCRNRCCGPCGSCGSCAGGACATYGGGGMTPMYGGAQPTYGGGGFVPPQGSLDSSFYSPYATAQSVSPMLSSAGPVTTTTMSPVIGSSPMINGVPIASPTPTANAAIFAGRTDSLPTYR